MRSPATSPQGPLRPCPAPATQVVACAAAALLAAAGCGNSTLDISNPDIGLLAHWALDETEAGSVVADSSGFGLHGTPSASAPTPSADVAPVHFPNPRSLSFDGQAQWVSIGEPPLLDAGGPMTIAAWVRAADVSGYKNVLAHGWRNNPNEEVSLRIRNGNYEFTYWNSIDHVASAPIADSDVGTWIHLCGVFDGNEYRLYRNGAVAGSRTDSAAPPPNIAAPWAIGARAPMPDLLDRLFQGQLDDIRLYGRALAGTEVEALYHR